VSSPTYQALKTSPSRAPAKKLGGEASDTNPPFPILPQHFPSGFILAVGIHEIPMSNHGSRPAPLGVDGDNDDGDSVLRASNKRRRIAIACSACRTRKSRVRQRKSGSGGDY